MYSASLSITLVGAARGVVTGGRHEAWGVSILQISNFKFQIQISISTSVSIPNSRTLPYSYLAISSTIYHVG